MSWRRCHGTAEKAQPPEQPGARRLGRRVILAAEQRKSETRHAHLEQIAGAHSVAGDRLREEFGDELADERRACAGEGCAKIRVSLRDERTPDAIGALGGALRPDLLEVD